MSALAIGLAAAGAQGAGPPARNSTMTPAAAADFAPARIPSPGELEESGWKPSEGTRTPAELVQPRIPVQRGAALLASNPASLPRPAARLGASLVPLPLAARQELMERRETGEGPILAWTPRLDLRSAGGTAWILGIDARPYKLAAPPDQTDIQSAFRHGERRLAAAPLGVTAQLAVSPDRRFRLERPPRVADDTPIPSGTTLRPLSAPVAGDALLVTLDEGVSWWEASLGDLPKSSDRHELDATRVFVDGHRVYLTPLARAPDASRELLLVEPPGTEARPLPFPAPAGASWRCEISDLRRRETGLEALVLVHDPRLRRGPEQGAAASWAARLRWQDDAWQEIERIPLPGDARALRLLFDAEATELVLHHEDRVLARRPLAGT